MVAEMLRQLPLPDSVIKGVAWKTGTSNGNHDAWCFAFTEDYTLGVWFGNKDGTPSPALVGVTAAAPAAAQILNALYRFRKPPGEREKRPLPGTDQSSAATAGLAGLPRM